MCTADLPRASASFSSAPDALRMASAALDYLNSAEAAPVAASCGELLVALGEIQAKLTAVHAVVLRRFDAADGHDADGYGSSSAWLAAKAGMARKGGPGGGGQGRETRGG